MVLSHKHPQDYEQVAATLDDIRQTHQPFSTRHRIIDVQGRSHDVIVVAELLRDDGGEVIGTNGFYVDVTFPPEERESFHQRSRRRHRSQPGRHRISQGHLDDGVSHRRQHGVRGRLLAIGGNGRIGF